MENEAELTLTCRQCGKQFIFSKSEQEFYQLKGFTFPVHCKECRSIRRTQASHVCSKCGKKVEKESDLCCISCLELVRLGTVVESKAYKDALDEANIKLNAAWVDKELLAESMNAKLAAVESEKAQLMSEVEVKVNALESEKTKLLQENENKLTSIASEKAALALLLEQERQTVTDLKEKLSQTGKDLEKALNHRAALDYLEPTLHDIKASLAVLGRAQEGINQTLQQLTRQASEIPQSSSQFEAFKRIFRIGRKSSSPVN